MANTISLLVMLGSIIYICIRAHDNSYHMSRDISCIKDSMTIDHGSYHTIDNKLYVIPVQIPHGDLNLINLVEKTVKDKLKSLTCKDHEPTSTFIKLSGITM